MHINSKSLKTYEVNPPRSPRTAIKEKKMGRPLKIQKSATVDTGFPQSSTGVVGGNTALSGNQIQVRARVEGYSEGDGFIVRQKGSRKFLVTVGANTGVCSLVDVVNGALAEGEMTIEIIKSDSTTIRAKRISNHFAQDFSDNKFLLGPTATTATDPDTVRPEST